MPIRSLLLTITCLLCCGLSSCNRQDSATQVDEQQSSLAALEFKDLAGASKKLGDLEGQLILLNFWATWCIPCLAEMPALQNLYSSYREKGFQVVAVSVDQDIEAVREFVAKSKLTFPILIDSSLQSAEAFGVTGFPETFFLGPGGALLQVKDPDSGEMVSKIISDRPWDSPPYRKLIENVLDKTKASS